MTSLPDRPDLNQLRIQTKELKRALVAGDQSALDRVLASHPKFAGRPAERAEGRTFTLRDAQVTVARELGFESWQKLLDALDAHTIRWGASEDWSYFNRAFSVARELKHGYVGVDHLILALLKPTQPTPVSRTLASLGLTYELEDEIPMEQIVREALPEVRDIEVLTDNEGGELEHAAAPNKYRERPGRETS